MSENAIAELDPETIIAAPVSMSATAAARPLRPGRRLIGNRPRLTGRDDRLKLLVRHLLKPQTDQVGGKGTGGR